MAMALSLFDLHHNGIIILTGCPLKPLERLVVYIVPDLCIAKL